MGSDWGAFSGLKVWVKGAISSMLGGGLPAILAYSETVSNYESVDWHIVGKVFAAGAIFNLAAFLRSEHREDKALYTPVPGAEEMKRAAAAAGGN